MVKDDWTVKFTKYTVREFIEENHWNPKNPSTITLYDYFISGHRSIHNHTSANITLLMEIHLVIYRDSHRSGRPLGNKTY